MIAGCCKIKRRVMRDRWEGLLVQITLGVFRELLITIAIILLMYTLRLLTNHDTS